MTIPFDREGLSLPASHALLDILDRAPQRSGLNLTNLTVLTFHLRNPTYSPTAGGVHPVEIRLIHTLTGWRFDYITDFSYQGLGQDAELCKELDFNFQDNEHYLQGWGPLPMEDAQELFNMWQNSFLAYAQLGFFTVTVSGD
jgi:hypothetical protein